MKQLDIPFLASIGYDTPASTVMEALAAVPATALAEVPWPEFPYRPSVNFRIAHTEDSLVLLYDVREKNVKAVYRQPNDPVYKDSCVEFFLSFDGQHYYNLEFNCVGTGLIGYGGSDKAKRKRLHPDTVRKVKAYGSISASHVPDGTDTAWQLLLNIPLVVFEHHRITTMGGLQCRGNFYKCGDDLPVPHFVAWNRIEAPGPNFHLPQFFGELRFQ